MITLALAKILSPFFAEGCNNQFFFLPHWWDYLPAADQPSLPDCNVNLNSINDLWAIALVVVEGLLRVAGFVAVIAIIASGVQYMTASGNPEKGASARKRLQNSLIGLGIAVIASALVAFIGNSLN